MVGWIVRSCSQAWRLACVKVARRVATCVSRATVLTVVLSVRDDRKLKAKQKANSENVLPMSLVRNLIAKVMTRKKRMTTNNDRCDGTGRCL
jgi:hypothetical protein